LNKPANHVLVQRRTIRNIVSFCVDELNREISRRSAAFQKGFILNQDGFRRASSALRVVHENDVVRHHHRVDETDAADEDRRDEGADVVVDEGEILNLQIRKQHGLRIKFRPQGPNIVERRSQTRASEIGVVGKAVVFDGDGVQETAPRDGRARDFRRSALSSGQRRCDAEHFTLWQFPMPQNHLTTRSEISDDDSSWSNVIIVVVDFPKRILVCGVESEEAEVKLRSAFGDRVDDLDAGKDGEKSWGVRRRIHVDRCNVNVGADDDSTRGRVAGQTVTNAN
jgi:hypothetical protein